MKLYTQEELNYAVAVANKAGYQEGYDLGKKYFDNIFDAPKEIEY